MEIQEAIPPLPPPAADYQPDVDGDAASIPTELQPLADDVEQPLEDVADAALQMYCQTHMMPRRHRLPEMLWQSQQMCQWSAEIHRFALLESLQ